MLDPFDDRSLVVETLFGEYFGITWFFSSHKVTNILSVVFIDVFAKTMRLSILPLSFIAHKIIRVLGVIRK